MFEDQRSKKVILVAHCVLNMNARIDGCGYFPGAMGDIARLLTDSGVGILQMPCPELLFLGLDRSGCQRGDTTIGIREALLEEDGWSACRKLAQQLAYQVKQYQKHGFKVLGVVGNNGSPACGVDLTWHEDGGPGPGAGAFIMALLEEFERQGISLPIMAVKDHDWEQGLVDVKRFLEQASDPA